MTQDADMIESDEESRMSSSEVSPTVHNHGNNRTRNEPMDCYVGKNQPRFSIRKWTAVALWAYDITVDNCAICRNHIMDKCIECQSRHETTNVEENCSIAWGKCSHVFHLHCISKWLHTRQVCPLDNRTWEFKKYGD